MTSNADESARIEAVARADAQRITADRDADVARLRAWQELAVAIIAIGGSVVLTAIGIMKVDVTSNIITAIAMALVMRKPNGGPK